MQKVFAHLPYSPPTLVALVAAGMFMAGALFSACDSSGSNDGGQSLIPLERGNSWTYAVDDDEVETVSVSGTRTINDMEYAEVSGPDGPIFFLDERGGGIFIRDTFDSQEFLIKYPVEDGGVYNYTDSDDVTYEVTVSEQSVETGAGTFDALNYDIDGPDPQVDRAIFAPGVGLIRYEDGFDAGDLMSYDLE